VSALIVQAVAWVVTSASSVSPAAVAVLTAAVRLVPAPEVSPVAAAKPGPEVIASTAAAASARAIWLGVNAQPPIRALFAWPKLTVQDCATPAVPAPQAR